MKRLFGGIVLAIFILAFLAGVAFLVTCACLKMTPIDYWHQVFVPSMKALFIKPPVV